MHYMKINRSGAIVLTLGGDDSTCHLFGKGNREADVGSKTRQSRLGY